MVKLLHDAVGAARRIGSVIGAHAIKARQRRSVAVLVDAENISAKYFPQVVQVARSAGRVRIARAYGPPSLLNGEAWVVAAAAYGVELVPCSGCKSRKNSSDISLVVDAMDLLSSGKAETFVLVSDDTDFAPLARKLQSAGKCAIGVGRLNRNDQYQKAFDRFVLVTECSATVVAERNGGGGGVPAAMLKEAEAKTGIDRDILSAAITCAELGADANAWCSMSTFGSLIHKTLPGFSAQHYECKNLTAFVKKTCLFEFRDTRGEKAIRLKAA